MPMIPDQNMPMMPPDPSGLPPDVAQAAALLAGGGGFGEGPAGPPGPDGPPAGPPGFPPHGGGPTPAQHLRLAIESCQAALVADPHDGDSAKLASVIKALYSILEGKQSAQDRALGGDPAVMDVLRRGPAG